MIVELKVVYSQKNNKYCFLEETKRSIFVQGVLIHLSPISTKVIPKQVLANWNRIAGSSFRNPFLKHFLFKWEILSGDILNVSSFYSCWKYKFWIFWAFSCHIAPGSCSIYVSLIVLVNSCSFSFLLDYETALWTGKMCS